ADVVVVRALAGAAQIVAQHGLPEVSGRHAMLDVALETGHHVFRHDAAVPCVVGLGVALAHDMLPALAMTARSFLKPSRSSSCGSSHVALIASHAATMSRPASSSSPISSSRSSKGASS